MLTEWDEYHDLDYAKIFKTMTEPVFAFDGRNLLDLRTLEEIGFRAFGIGKGEAGGIQS